ncbi:lactoylglutathione lyase family protein [Terriglobus roseus DSM 18391]|uniref:Lactoylglutathione lyase family protein n=1 Tax=Terriglobus roseus (strain DSM 18391 / NRRL B-41598 / KBS 63) TaxID=926566 RepID=I3ZLU0_TERRK|nr:VOC family protein [Terriglobus roseus]AFL90208.1 lactoylglutathione lyase family protein [Terriglobus roseus DSM 18391]
MNKSGFVWYELMTSGDLDPEVAFYKNVVGWDVKDSGMPGMQYLLFGKDGKDVGGMMSWKSVGMDLPTEWVAHIHTTDVDAEVASVVKDGGTQIQPPRDIPGVGRFAVVTDPQGAKYLLFQPGPGSAPPRLAQNEVGNVGWNELATTDWQKAWEFYSKHYGWEKDFAIDMKEMGTYQTFRTDTDKYIGAMMNIAPFMKAKPGWFFYFQVPDADAGAKRITDNGGTITHGPADVPGGSRIVQGIDPQGGNFALVSTTA